MDSEVEQLRAETKSLRDSLEILAREAAKFYAVASEVQNQAREERRVLFDRLDQCSRAIGTLREDQASDRAKWNVVSSLGGGVIATLAGLLVWIVQKLGK